MTVSTKTEHYWHRKSQDFLAEQLYCIELDWTDEPNKMYIGSILY